MTGLATIPDSAQSPPTDVGAGTDAPASVAPPAMPERRCLVTGQVRPIAELVRFAVDPDGNIVPDVAGRLPGRGLWLLPRRDILVKAFERGKFARAAHRQVHRPADNGQALAATVDALLARRCVEFLGLARRAGQAVMGFDQVHGWLRALPASAAGAVLLQAADGSAGSCARLTALADAIAPRVARVDVFSAAELARAFGRDRVVHVGLGPAAGPVRPAGRLVAEARRLSGFRVPAGVGNDRGRDDGVNALEGAGGVDG